MGKFKKRVILLELLNERRVHMQICRVYRDSNATIIICNIEYKRKTILAKTKKK